MCLQFKSLLRYAFLFFFATCRAILMLLWEGFDFQIFKIHFEWSFLLVFFFAFLYTYAFVYASKCAVSPFFVIMVLAIIILTDKVKDWCCFCYLHITPFVVIIHSISIKQQYYQISFMCFWLVFFVVQLLCLIFIWATFPIVLWLTCWRDWQLPPSACCLEIPQAIMDFTPEFSIKYWLSVSNGLNLNAS